METNFIKRVCDSPLCDTVMTINQQKPDLEALATWIVVATFAVQDAPPNPQNPGGKQLVQTLFHCCRSQCALNVLNLNVSANKELGEKLKKVTKTPKGAPCSEGRNILRVERISASANDLPPGTRK